MTPAYETEPIMLDFIGPARAGGDRAADRWQTRLDEAGRTEWRAATITGASTECESAADIARVMFEKLGRNKALQFGCQFPAQYAPR